MQAGVRQGGLFDMMCMPAYVQGLSRAFYLQVGQVVGAILCQRGKNDIASFQIQSPKDLHASATMHVLPTLARHINLCVNVLTQLSVHTAKY